MLILQGLCERGQGSELGAFLEAEEGKDHQGLYIICETSQPVWYGKVRMEGKAGWKGGCHRR